jgi:hypothetical protein
MSLKIPLLLSGSYGIFWALRKNTKPENTIPYTELLAYIQLYGIKMEPYEINFIKEIDYVYVTEFNKGNSQ